MDNISIASTASSASVMLRKFGGNVGKLARRHSLASMTNLFRKDKKSDAQHDATGQSDSASSSIHSPEPDSNEGFAPPMSKTHQHIAPTTLMSSMLNQAASQEFTQSMGLSSTAQASYPLPFPRKGILKCQSSLISIRMSIDDQ